jgi:hypothetical protein
MAADADGVLDDRVGRKPAREKLKELTLAPKLVLVGGALLFLSLFFTWQNLEIDFGPTGTGTQPLDGWDVFGLVIGLLTLALVALVLILDASNVDVSPELNWDLIVLVLASTVFGLVVLKNLTDQDSAWVSYVAIILAATAVAGAYLDWSGWQPRRPPPRRKRRRVTPYRGA